MKPAALQALLRVERRQLLRAPRRTALLVLLVAVPVAAVVAASTLARISEPTAEERSTNSIGQAHFAVDDADTHAARSELIQQLPSHAQTGRVFLGVEQVRAASAEASGRLVALEPETLEGMARGMVTIASGHAPRNPGDVALSPALLEALRAKLGDTVTLSYGPTRTVCGIVINPEQLDEPLVLRTPATVEYRGTHRMLVQCSKPPDQALAAQLQEAGFNVQLRGANDGGGLADILFIFGSIGFFEAAMVMGAAFAVGLRRRRLELGLLGACGAERSGMTASLLMGALLQALLGGLLGPGIGIGSAAALHPFLDNWNQRLNGPFEIAWLHAVAAITLGLIASTLAAAIPAWHATGQPIREALGARRPGNRAGGRLTPIGAALLVAGVAVFAFAPRSDTPLGGMLLLTGPLLVLVGLGLSASGLLQRIAGAASHLPPAWRLAVRDAGRFRSRNAPVVTAVLGGMAMSVTVAILVNSLESAFNAFPQRYRDDQVLVQGPRAEAFARALASQGAVACAPLQAVYAGGQPVRARIGSAPPPALQREWIAVADADMLAATGLTDATEALQRGHLLVAQQTPPTADVELRTWLSDVSLPVPPVQHAVPSQNVAAPRFLLDRRHLAARQMRPGPPLRHTLTPWLVRFPTPIEEDQLRALQQQANDQRFVGTTIDANLLHGEPARQAYYVALALCALTGWIVIGVATSLSAEESREDARTLHAVGAAPNWLRQHRAAYAAYLALLGCVLAVPAGLLPALSILEVANLDLPFVMPWRDVFVIVFGLPLVTFVATWLTAGTPHLQQRSLT